MFVCNGSNRRDRHIAFQRIAFRQAFLRPRILDYLTVRVLLQMLNLGFPFVFCVKHNGLVSFGPVSQKLHSQVLRTVTILVILIVPDFLH